MAVTDAEVLLTFTGVGGAGLVSPMAAPLTLAATGLMGDSIALAFTSVGAVCACDDRGRKSDAIKSIHSLMCVFAATAFLPRSQRSATQKSLKRREAYGSRVQAICRISLHANVCASCIYLSHSGRVDRLDAGRRCRLDSWRLVSRGGGGTIGRRQRCLARRTNFAHLATRDTNRMQCTASNVSKRGADDARPTLE